ncbi:MAG TPA: LCP family protein, partial [Candidatus Saccharimonadales bacterium]|nr:LCP family protein [Candidatus Saccharimonadales bacterium]
MQQTPYNPRTPMRRSPLQRPVQDMVTAQKQGGQFPTVGMTLRNYQYDPRDRHKRVDHTAVKKAHWWNRVTPKRALVTFFILLLLVGGFVAGKFIYNAHKLFGGNILSVLRTTTLRGEKEGRVNILLAGNSADDPGHSGARLTDSIMLVSIDTKKNTMFMLSIPRDLWVEVDGSHQKINQAYVTGEDEGFEESDYPKGGMGQLEQVVSENFGLPIHYYALIDYNALKQSV